MQTGHLRGYLRARRVKTPGRKENMERPSELRPEQELYIRQNLEAYSSWGNMVLDKPPVKALLGEIDRLRFENTTLQQQLREVNESKDATIHSWRTEADRLATVNEDLREKNARLKEVATALWSLLDDIDSAEDACHPEESSYYRNVQRIHQKRFQYAESHDGQTLNWKLVRLKSDWSNPHLPGCDHFALPACHCREVKK